MRSEQLVKRRSGDQTVRRYFRSTTSALALSLLAFAGWSGPAAAQTSETQTSDAQEEPAQSEAEQEVVRLRERAETLFAETTPSGDGAAVIIAAWEDVQAAAQAISADHPEIARAKIRIASQLYALGRNAEAREEVEAGLQALSPDDTSMLAARGEGIALLGTILAQAGEAEAAVGSLRDGYERFMESYSQLTPDEIGRGQMMTKSNLEFSLSQVMLRLSELDEALNFQMASLNTREEFLGPNDPDTISSYYGYAGTLRRAGQMAEAERFARIAVDRTIDHVDPSHPTYARALEMLAIILSRSGRPIEATDYLTRSLELKRKYEGADSLFFGYGIHLLGTILHQRERYADSVQLFTEAAPIFAKYQGEESPFGLGSLAYAAQGEFALGNEANALERLLALDARMGEESRDLEITQRIGPDLVRGLIRVGETSEAARIATRDYNRLAEAEDGDAFALRHARLVDFWARASAGKNPDLAVSEARAMLGYFERARIRDLAGLLVVEQRAALDLIMEIAIAANDNDLLAQAIALGTGSGIAQATALRSDRLNSENPEFAQALRELQNAEAEVDAADRAVLRALSMGASLEPQRERLTEANAARELALEQIRGLGAELEALVTPPDVSVTSIQARLGEGEAMLAIAPAYDGAYSLLVTADAAYAQRISVPRAELVALAERVRDGAANLQFDQQAAERLSALLLTPDMAALLDSTQVLRIVAGGPLASLPFGILPFADESAEQAWLMDRFALVNIASIDAPAPAPSAEMQGLGRAARQDDSDLSRFVAFAAPTPFGEAGDAVTLATAIDSPTTYFARSGANVAQLAGLPALPQSENEARAIARQFGSDRAKVFVGDEASETNLSDPSVSAAQVILFATHGLVAGEVEGIAEPALILARPNADGAGGAEADGVLTASEIAKLNLSADWVILTACDSAAGFSGGVLAFSGLVSAFRFAGGGSLLATHWQVRDDVAAYVAVETLRHYRIHGNKALALNHALRSLRTVSGLAGARSPDVWGPFVLIE